MVDPCDIDDEMWSDPQSETSTNREEDRDQIGLVRVIGLEIHQDDTGLFEVHKRDLDQNDISQWLQKNNAKQGIKSSLRLKLLMGEQVLQYDHLRPKADAFAVRFSRNEVNSSFGYPQIALEMLSRTDPWFAKFAKELPEGKDKDNSPVFGFGAGGTRSIWTYIADCNTTYAVMVEFHCFREHFEGLCKRLSAFCEFPQFLPLLFLKLIVPAVGRGMTGHMSEMPRMLAVINRQPNTDDVRDLLRKSTDASEMFVQYQRGLKTILEMVDTCMSMSPPGFNDKGSSDGRFKRLNTSLSYYRARVVALDNDAAESSARASWRLQTTLAISARLQQEASIELAKAQMKLAEDSRRDQAISMQIAEASKTIAEETKKDGSSMKTLAVMTLVFLPCTTVSSILAMPLFNWQADGASVVNPRIWIYFILSVPLTMLTIGIWRLWLGVRARKLLTEKSIDARSPWV
jgi:hypothetical protein